MKRRGRPRTGTAVPHGDHFDARITLPDGTRGRFVCLPPGLSEAQAREIALAMTQAATQAPPVTTAAPPPDESWSAWSMRWLEARRLRGLASTDEDRARLTKWAFPHLGHKPMREITRRDLEELVERIDTSVREEELSWKTAQNVWGAVSKCFDDACSSKTLALRVLETNPADGVRGPDRGATKSKVYLLPVEFLALVSCERVPLRWRRIYALGCYTYMRAGELRALEWPDISFDGGYVHVHKSLTDKGTVKSTKTKETRKVPIEANLLPLLQAMHAEAKEPTGRVLTIPANAAEVLREHLARAGITRADLFADDASRKPLTFHDAGRATGATWMALRGDDPLKIQRRLGHASLETTQIYIREAESLGDFGEPFPRLPAALVGGAS